MAKNPTDFAQQNTERVSFGETLVPWEKMSSTLLLPEQPANTVPKPAARPADGRSMTTTRQVNHSSTR